MLAYGIAANAVMKWMKQGSCKKIVFITLGVVYYTAGT